MTPIERATQAIIADLHRQAERSGCRTQDDGVRVQIHGTFEVEPLVWAVVDALRPGTL